MLREWITSYADKWLRKNIPVIQSLSDSQFMFQGTSRTLTQTLGSTVTDPYSTHAWVRGAIESVALNMAGTPLMWKNSRDKIASLRDAEPWITLFEKPNELMGQQQLFEATVVYLLHYGECMWVLDRTEPTGIPTAIQPFNGQLFEAVLSNDGKLLRWKVESTLQDGQKRPIYFEKWEVCFFKLFNPYTNPRGWPPCKRPNSALTKTPWPRSTIKPSSRTVRCQVVSLRLKRR